MLQLLKLLKVNNDKDLKIIPQAEVKSCLEKNNNDYLQEVIKTCIKNCNHTCNKYLCFIVMNFTDRINDKMFKEIIKYALDYNFNATEELLLYISKTNRLDILPEKKKGEFDYAVSVAVTKKMRDEI